MGNNIDRCISTTYWPFYGMENPAMYWKYNHIGDCNPIAILGLLLHIGRLKKNIFSGINFSSSYATCAGPSPH